MTKAELEKRIEALERELRNVTHQLNNHVCDRAAPVFIRPYDHPVPVFRPYVQPGQTSPPPQWPMSWNICGALT